jgi:hypothetical protein|eukprot:COSAG03_NODE_311_length_9123_cov_2.643506_11_plen_95_part_00
MPVKYAGADGYGIQSLHPEDDPRAGRHRAVSSALPGMVESVGRNEVAVVRPRVSLHGTTLDTCALASSVCGTTSAQCATVPFPAGDGHAAGSRS